MGSTIIRALVNWGKTVITDYAVLGTSVNESTVGAQASVKLYDMKLSGSSISLQKVVVANKSSKSLPIASAELTTKYNSQVISLLHRSAFQVSHIKLENEALFCNH